MIWNPMPYLLVLLLVSCEGRSAPGLYSCLHGCPGQYVCIQRSVAGDGGCVPEQDPSVCTKVCTADAECNQVFPDSFCTPDCASGGICMGKFSK